MIAPPSMYAKVGRMFSVVAQVVADRRFASTGAGRPVVRGTRRRVAGTTPLVASCGGRLSALVANVALRPSASFVEGAAGAGREAAMAGISLTLAGRCQTWRTVVAVESGAGFRKTGL
jgi:hypothetical protein